MTLTNLPLNSLILSRLNVRHTERDADIAALAEDIAARGLKQNLVVVPAHFSTGETDADWDNKWEVIAGGRRFQAMQLLVSDDRLPADHPVPCLLEDRADASETSLSENLHKVAMNPADEFAAFHTIVEDRKRQGDTPDAAIAACAKRFGKTVAYVEGRMRLATLAPEILDALRADKISVEAAKAYARTTDHDLQRKVFAMHEKEDWRGHKPSVIRSDLGGLTLPIDHPLANFVGLVSYQAAGGRIEVEMFMGTEQSQRLTDVALLKKLARQIAEGAIPALAKKDGCKSGLYAEGIGNGATYPKVPADFERAWDYGAEVSKAQLKKSIGIYAINETGATLERIGRFKPKEKKEQHSDRDWMAERAAEHRLRLIDRKAAHLALPKFAGTPLEGLLHYPNYDGAPIECDEDHIFVPMWIKVSLADFEAQRTDAERLVDEAIAAEAATKAAPSTDEAEA